MKNRYGDKYWFEKVNTNTYVIKGELSHWRCGGKEGEEGVNSTDLGFIDPSGGPFISIGYEVDNKKVTRIYRDDAGFMLEVA